MIDAHAEKMIDEFKASERHGAIKLRHGGWIPVDGEVSWRDDDCLPEDEQLIDFWHGDNCYSFPAKAIDGYMIRYADDEDGLDWWLDWCAKGKHLGVKEEVSS